jgi:DNA-binding response OmpR family regulator
MAHILVVDDDPDIRGLVEFRLRKAGHQVLVANDGASALAAVDERGHPDLAVLDVAMPGMNGLELLVALRDRAELRALPAIFLSARMLPSDVAAGRALGASYLTKPFVAPALMAAVTTALSSEDERAATAAAPEPEAPGLASADPAQLRDADARRAATSKAPPGF